MAPPYRVESIQKEGQIALAVNAIRKNQISSGRSAAKAYIIPRTILQDRLNSRLPQLGSKSITRLLQEYEESLLISWIYSIERRGFLLYIIDVRRMAQILIDQRRLIKPI